MTELPKVSVSVTTYNHESYIAQALDGILMQEADFDYEIVIGEDCSSDGTRDIVKSYQERHPDKIRSVLPPQNLGNGGKPIFVNTIHLCRGQYIAAMDGDDYWTSPKKLQCQVDFLDRHPQCSMCFHNVLNVHDDATAEDVCFNPPDQKPFSDMADVLEGCFIASCSPLFRQSVLTSIPGWYNDLPWGDWPLYMWAAEHGTIGYIGEVWGVYRIHSRGMWSGMSSVEATHKVIEFYQKIRLHLNPDHRKIVTAKISKLYLSVASEYKKNAAFRQARIYALKSVLTQPWPPHRAALRLAKIFLNPTWQHISIK